METVQSSALASQVDTKPIETKLSLLRDRASAIVVSDAESYSAACQIALDGRAEVKAIGFVLDPGIASAKAHLETLRNQKAGFVDRVNPIIEIAAQKAETWKAEERRKAQAEQDRINEQRRIEAARVAAEERRAAEAQAEADRKTKAKELEAARKAGEINKRESEKMLRQAAADAERQKQLAAQQEKETVANVQEVRVAPSVPKVSGIKARVNYKFQITNPRAVKPQFTKPDEVAIGTKVRADKDPAQSEREIGGIHVWTEDGI